MTSRELEGSLDKTGEEQKKGKTFYVLNGHCHLLGVHSTFTGLLTLFCSCRSAVSDSQLSYRRGLYKLKGQLAFNKELNTVFPKRILTACYAQNRNFPTRLNQRLV